MVALQPARKRVGPGVLHRLMRKTSKRAAAKAWHEDGMAVMPNVDHAVEKQSCRYLHETHQALLNQPIIELLMDSTVFATQDVQVHIGFASHSRLAMYLPPCIMRHLLWRAGAPGSDMSKEDLERFQNTGFKSKANMQSIDCINSLNHVLEISCGKSLEMFKAPCKLPPMDPHSARWWCIKDKRWMRTGSSPASGAGSEIIPELPNSLFSATGIHVLLVTADQKQSQWSALQYMADQELGLGLMCAFREDPYHRSWRDFVWVMNHAFGSFHHTAVQLNFAFNVNYAPFGKGTHLAKRQEMLQEWGQLFPRYGDEFEAICPMIALDARQCEPQSEFEKNNLYNKHILHNVSYQIKGPYMRQSSWFSIIKLIDQHDPVFHARRYHAEQVAELFGSRPGGKADAVALAEIVRIGDQINSAANAVHSDAHRSRENPEAGIATNAYGLQDPRESQTSTKETQLSELRKLRKQAGNALLLAPRLLHDQNLINARIMLLVGKHSWSEQTWWSVQKTTCEEDRTISSKYSCGLGEQILHKTWFDALFDPVELARFGIEAVKGQLHFQPPLGALVEQRLMSFLLHNLEARFWSYAWRQWAFPEAFAALLSPHVDERHTQVEWWHALFLATTDAEAEQNSGVIGPSVIAEISLPHLPSSIPLAAFVPP
jgi:hypothetical protein